MIPGYPRTPNEDPTPRPRLEESPRPYCQGVEGGGFRPDAHRLPADSGAAGKG
jgi:hypothetical protein